MEGHKKAIPLKFFVQAFSNLFNVFWVLFIEVYDRIVQKSIAKGSNHLIKCNFAIQGPINNP